jgi:hypothetical protein
LTVARDRDIPALIIQSERQHVAEALLVVDDQDAAHSMGLLRTGPGRVLRPASQYTEARTKPAS